MNDRTGGRILMFFLSELSCIPYLKVHMCCIGDKRINPWPRQIAMDIQTETTSSSSQEDSTCSSTDWRTCCLFQSKTSEKLVDATSSGYLTLAKNIPQFYNMNCMPVPFDPKRIDDGNGILLTLEKNKATRHEACKLKFKSSKLERKRKLFFTSEEKCEASSSKFTRSSLKKTDAEEADGSEEMGECFICDKPAKIGDLHQAMALPLPTKLQTCAEKLLDNNLLARLST